MASRCRYAHSDDVHNGKIQHGRQDCHLAHASRRIEDELTLRWRREEVGAMVLKIPRRLQHVGEEPIATHRLLLMMIMILSLRTKGGTPSVRKSHVKSGQAAV